ncbi:hypothetical protein PanWU01x14_011760 [Parasponia andersonii]|uniref:Uncharacterized protein n=1 Tax=Parasponia andersonii TaxID=3476 RepID=A0A2P5E1M2_PARAD|nr:hypothetical protein PanWU01x14_011760 [Parasponia andersonii]
MDMKPWLLDQYPDVGTLLIQKESRDCPPQVKLFKTWAQMSDDPSYHTRMEYQYSKGIYVFSVCWSFLFQVISGSQTFLWTTKPSPYTFLVPDFD